MILYNCKRSCGCIGRGFQCCNTFHLGFYEHLMFNPQLLCNKITHPSSIIEPFTPPDGYRRLKIKRFWKVLCWNINPWKGTALYKENFNVSSSLYKKEVITGKKSKLCMNVTMVLNWWKRIDFFCGKTMTIFRFMQCLKGY